MRIGLVIEYEGTDFLGSQLQSRGRTVQGELERALEALFQTATRARMASRTDTGVHARGQVAAFDFETRLSMTTIRDALNHYLPGDIGVRHAARVADSFDPRRHAIRREYVYTINDSQVPSPIDRRFEAHVRGPLDVEAMAGAARGLEGTHDFAAFCGGALPVDASTVRRMDQATVCRDDRHVRITFLANAYLNQQVRRMAGALMQVGAAMMSPERFAAFVSKPVRGDARVVAQPHGLCLTRIEYRGGTPSGLPALNEA
ncbi:MAG: tRNA pseudouridine(38-40) synthase TruA [Chloroflexi bacterium]|nr:tRNA pseudouridine(38-40) synthase TruA [Chloroflexota bacterium]